MMTSLLVFLSLAVAAGAAAASARRNGVRQFVNRSCAGRAWRSAFPAASKDEIRAFLDVFCEAFLFPKSQGLRFRPEDRIMDVYRAIYPSKLMADTLEWEFLRAGLQRKYQLDFATSFSPELTLGALFSSVKNA